MAAARARRGQAARWPRAARSTPSASPTSGPRPSCGTAPPASRSAPASAGRTCAPSARASCCRPSGIRLAPNASATKLAFLLDMADPDRSRDLCFGTVDTWVAWTLSGGARSTSPTPPTPASPACCTPTAGVGRRRSSSALNIPASVLPTIVDSSGVVGPATALPGAPPIAGIAGDQQASLIGQGCVRPGLAKITFGTGGMLDLCVGDRPPGLRRARRAAASRSSPGGAAGDVTWGIEAVMLSAGTNVEWLRDDLGIIATSAESDAVAAACADTGDVWFVPALLGLGTPHWDYGARGTLLGLTRGTGRAEIVRAVLEGVAHRGADLVEAAEADGGRDHRVAARRRRHERQPHVRAGPGRRHPTAGRGVARCWRPPPSAPPSWPAWPSASGPNGTSEDHQCRRSRRRAAPCVADLAAREVPETRAAGRDQAVGRVQAKGRRQVRDARRPRRRLGQRVDLRRRGDLRPQAVRRHPRVGRQRSGRRPRARPHAAPDDRPHLRRDAARLLRPRRPHRRHGAQLGRRLAAVPDVPPLLRPDVPRERGPRARAGLRAGLQRLDGRGVVRARRAA